MSVCFQTSTDFNFSVFYLYWLHVHNWQSLSFTEHWVVWPLTEVVSLAVIRFSFRKKSNFARAGGCWEWKAEKLSSQCMLWAGQSSLNQHTPAQLSHFSQRYSCQILSKSKVKNKFQSSLFQSSDKNIIIKSSKLSEFQL